MQIEVKSDNAYARKVTVRVPADRVRDELDRAFKRIGDRARVPGFRPGKVPRQVLDARFGDRVREDVATSLIQFGWTRAMNTHKLEPVSRPSVIAQDELHVGKEFGFTISVEVRPAIIAQSYTGLTVQWPASEVSEAEVDISVDSRRRSQARLAPVEDRPVRIGDTVQVEVKAEADGALLLDEPGTLVRTAGDPWLNGLEPLLVGLAVGEDKASEVTFAQTARQAAIAGKTANVTVKVLSIQEMVVPPLTDELAKELGADDVVSLREATRANLNKGREELSRNQARANLLQALIEANPFEVPASMVEQNLQLLMEELKMQRAYAGQDPRSMTFDAAQMADLRMRAAFAAKGGILLESVSKLESIAVSDEDIEAKIAELAATRGQNVESVRAYFAEEEARLDLAERIKEEKTLDWLLDRSNVQRPSPAAEAAAAEAAPAEAAPADAGAPAPVEEAPVDEAPKKKKSTKKASEEAAAPAEAAEAAAPAAAEEEAPKKKKSTKKAAEEAPADAPAEAADAEAAPKKKRSTKKADAAE